MKPCLLTVNETFPTARHHVCEHIKYQIALKGFRAI